MKVLLTGAAGHVGSAIHRALLDAGFDLRATDRKYRRGQPGKVVIDNLLNRDAAYRLLEDVETVVHVANHPSTWSGDAQTVFNDNMTMNLNLFEAAHQMGVRKIIFTSSVQVFSGDRGADPESVSELAYLPLDGDVPANPGNYYAQSKHFSELLLQSYARKGMSAVAVRPPAVPSDP